MAADKKMQLYTNVPGVEPPKLVESPWEDLSRGIVLASLRPEMGNTNHIHGLLVNEYST